MSDHKFEKQVRQKLGDLKLTPTPESWEKIENEIRERKRRPAPIFWLPLLLLGLGAGGYFMLKPTFTAVPLAVKETKTPATIDKTFTPEAPKTTVPANKPTEKAEITQPSQRTQHTMTPGSSRAGRGKISATNTKREIPAKGDIKKNKTDERSHEPLVAKTESAEEKETEETIAPAISQQRNKQPFESEPDADQKKSIVQQELSPGAEVAQPAEQKKKDQSKDKKWSFGVTAFAGVSAINEGKFVNLGAAQVEDVAVIPNFANPVVLPNATPPPSKLYPGFAYSLGLTAKRELSERFSLSAGINYLQLNTVTKVGYKVNNLQIVNSGSQGFSPVNTYYLPPDDYINEYKNRYHFIEVPVTLHTRITKWKKLPIHWNLGISASTLLQSTAVHYDGTAGVYYKDDALLNQVQSAVTTGFSFSLFNKSSKPLWIGPTVRYNISPVLKKDVSASKNFMGLGLDVRWFLK